MPTLPAAILSQAQSLPEGGVLLPKMFLHLAKRPAVDQAFSRLTKNGRLQRVERGAYVVPVSGRFGPRAPAVGKVIKALAAERGKIIVPHGASAANSLGLTRQVPIREVYLTNGRTRKLKLGRSEVLIKRSPYWMLSLGTGQAGEAVRALAWMGPKQANKAVASLRLSLPNPEWQELTAARAMLPDWMARAIGKEMVRD